MLSNTHSRFNHLTDKYKSYKIDKIRVVRTPLPNALQFLAKMIGVKSPSNADKLFHLFTEFSLVNQETGHRTVLKVERNQLLNAVENRPGGLTGKEIGVTIPGFDSGASNLTLGEYIDDWKTKHREHGANWNKYDVRCNNCQHFTKHGLEAQGWLSPALNQWIDQRVSKLIPRFWGNLANKITDFAAIKGTSSTPPLPQPHHPSHHEPHHHEQPQNETNPMLA